MDNDMLRKLIKHEFKALSKSIVLILMLVLATSVTTALLSRITAGIFSNNNLSSGFISGLFGLFAWLGFAALIATPFITLILVINRYYTNFFKDEGYLTFTLPVSTSSLYNTKLICGAIMLVISAVIGICGAVFTLMILTGDGNSFLNTKLIADIYNIIVQAFNLQFTMTEVILVIDFILYFIAESLNVLILIYLAITIVSTRFNKHRVLIGIAIYYGFNIGKNIINTLSMAIFSGFNFNEDPFTGSQDVISTITVYMLVTILISIAISVFAYSYNRKVLSKNLNLD